MANLNEPYEIFIEFLRSTVSEVTRVGLSNRHTNTTKSFSGNNVLTEFTLTSTPVQCINSVTVDAVTMKKYYDYDIDIRNNKIVFGTAPGAGTNNIVVDYDYGTAWIHRDRERTAENWKASAFPKIIVTVISESGDQMGMNDDSYWDTISFQVDVLSWKDQKCTISGETQVGQPVADYLARKIRQSFKSGNHRTHLANKLEFPTIIRNIPLPFDESHNIFRRLVEVQFKTQDAGTS